jgi:hypothetical protein
MGHGISERNGKVRITRGDQPHILDRTARHFGGCSITANVLLDDLGQTTSEWIIDSPSTCGSNGKLFLRKHRCSHYQSDRQGYHPKSFHSVLTCQHDCTWLVTGWYLEKNQR